LKRPAEKSAVFFWLKTLQQSVFFYMIFDKGVFIMSTRDRALELVNVERERPDCDWIELVEEEGGKPCYEGKN